jgi:two-component system, chemotaxis family, chemotaxis protein CheY
MSGSHVGPDPQPQNVTALIVDDDPDMRLLLRGFLTRAGLQVVEEAVDGPEALEVFERLDPPPVPTVIVLDNRMPTMTGLDVAELVLQRLPGQRIVLFSAYLDADIEQRAAALGISACLAKTEIRRLADVISELVAA